MQKFDLRLAIRRGEPHFVTDLAPAGVQDFTFNLCHQDASYGSRQFRHWWMDIRSIYPTRGRTASNFDSLVDFWWRSCCENGTPAEPDVCQSYLLVKLFNQTRSTGSRRVLLDSIPRAGNMVERQNAIANLENLLSHSVGEEISLIEFSRNSGRLLGPPEYADEVRDLYCEFTNQLFQTAVPQLMSGREELGLTAVNDVWSAWDAKYGRRGGAELEKQFMDILSYEARASIHRCYSHLWETIANWLVSEHRCSIASFVFHRFWHLDLCWPSNESSDANFHLFHGHIIGLHPATGLFVQTDAGNQLLGDWLAIAPQGWERSSNPETPELRRLLYGLFVAIADYTNRHREDNDLRRSQVGQMPEEISLADAVDDGSSFAQVTRRNERKPLAE